MQNEIINILPNQDDYVIGFADMGDLIKDHYPYRYAVVIGKKLNDKIIDEIKDGPTMAYYELYKATNDELNLITAQSIQACELFSALNEMIKVEPLRQEPEAPYNNATSRELHRIHPPAGAGE